MREAYAVLLIPLLLVGCVGANKIIAGGALTVKQAAVLVQSECRNTIPDGPCVATSRITTEEKNELKVRLQTALDLLAIASQTNTDAQSRADALGKVDEILATIEAVLVARGIE